MLHNSPKNFGDTKKTQVRLLSCDFVENAAEVEGPQPILRSAPRSHYGPDVECLRLRRADPWHLDTYNCVR